MRQSQLKLRAERGQSVALDSNSLSSRLCIVNPHLDAVGGFELAYEAGIPKLRRDAKIFAAAHQRVRLCTFRGSCDAVWIKIFLLSTSSGYESAGNKVVSTFAAADLSSPQSLTSQDRPRPTLLKLPLLLRWSLREEPWPNRRDQKRESECDDI